jgi:hypothetical protein
MSNCKGFNTYNCPLYILIRKQRNDLEKNINQSNVTFREIMGNGYNYDERYQKAEEQIRLNDDLLLKQSSDLNKFVHCVNLNKEIEDV